MHSKAIKLLLLFYCWHQIDGQFCNERKFDAIYTNDIYKDSDGIFSSIQIVINDKMYKWNLKTNNISEPVLWTETSVLVKIFIGMLPNCENSGTDCDELSKLSNKAIIFYRKIGTYSYEIKSKDEECIDCVLPWNMSAKGNPIKEHHLWPKHWIKKSQPVAAFDPLTYQLIFVINPSSHLDRVKIQWKYLNVDHWTDSWEETESQISHTFIGLVPLFAINASNGAPLRPDFNRIFGFSFIEGPTHSVYEYKNNYLTESSFYDYHYLFGCIQKTEKLSESTTYWIFGATSIIVIVIIIILVVMAYLFGRRRKGSTHFHLKSSSSSFGSSSDGNMSRRSASRD